MDQCVHNDFLVALAFKVKCDDLQLALFTNNMLCNFKDQLIFGIRLIFSGRVGLVVRALAFN